MKHEVVPLLNLIASGQPRPLITEAVDKLAASIAEVGLIQPITVRRAVIVSGIAKDGFQIVAGHHRVAAARALGWTEIDAIVVDTEDHLTAELVEIDENLCRAELTAAQRAAHIKRRKVIWEALHPNTGASCASNADTRGRGRPKEFAADTAAVAGESKSQINRHVARAEALGDDINRVVGTSLDKGVELDALKDLPQEERRDLIERAAKGEKVSAKAKVGRAIDSKEARRSFFVHALSTGLKEMADSAGHLTIESMVDEIAADFRDASEKEIDSLFKVLAYVDMIAALRRRVAAQCQAA